LNALSGKLSIEAWLFQRAGKTGDP
jgi:hypothetical protein